MSTQQYYTASGKPLLYSLKEYREHEDKRQNIIRANRSRRLRREQLPALPVPGKLVCEFQAPQEELQAFYNQHFGDPITICPNVEAVRWQYPNIIQSNH